MNVPAAAWPEEWLGHFQKMLDRFDDIASGQLTVAGFIPDTEIGVFAGVLVLLLAGVQFWRRTADAALALDNEPLAVLTHGPRRTALIAVALLISGLGGWSWFAPLTSATAALGVVAPDGNRKSVQHLEGGIVKEIRIREGVHVEQGQPLLIIDDTQVRAHLDEVVKSYHHLLATEARFEAMIQGKSDIAFPSDITSLPSDQRLAVTESQSSGFQSWLSIQKVQIDVIEARIRQLNDQKSGLLGVVEAKKRQLALMRDEISTTEELVSRGLERRPRLLQILRGEAELEAEVVANLSQLEEIQQKIGEARLQLAGMQETASETASRELADIRRSLSEVRTRIPAINDQLARTIVRAPVSGTVMGLQISAASEVVRPGMTLLEIVPDNASLVINARIRPADIDRISAGMTAQVILPAYQQKSLPKIYGILDSISADRFSDERSGEQYFLAKISVEKEELAKLGDARMLTGMSAEVMVVQAETTLIRYLMDPILASFRRSFHQ